MIKSPFSNFDHTLAEVPKNSQGCPKGISSDPKTYQKAFKKCPKDRMTKWPFSNFGHTLTGVPKNSQGCPQSTSSDPKTDQKWARIYGFPTCPTHQVIKNGGGPIFPGSQVSNPSRSPYLSISMPPNSLYGKHTFSCNIHPSLLLALAGNIILQILLNQEILETLSWHFPPLQTRKTRKPWKP